MFTRKAQLEIMGLAIVVVLISLIFLFVLSFNIAKEPNSNKNDFTQSQIAANTINSLLLTSTTCQGLDMTELIQDCASLSDVDCIGNDGIADSCDFVEREITSILDSTLKVWKKNYQLNAMQSSNALFQEISNGQCEGSLDSKTYPIPSIDNTGQIFVILKVCSS